MDTDHDHLLGHRCRAARRVASRQRHHPHFAVQSAAVGGGRTRGSHPHRGERGRAQRGDVRTALLLLLAEQPMHGYQLMQTITERTSGAWQPSPGAIYPTLSQLEDEGLIDTVAQGGRKLATLTNAGDAYLRSHADTLPDPFAEFTARRPGNSRLRDFLEQLRCPVRQLARGDDRQVQATQQILTEARRVLYLILAEPPTTGQEAS
jgi:DNA-binding PadR family transcriptional regulator